MDYFYIYFTVLQLAEQILSQFGCDETEQQCETHMCPDLVNKIDGHNTLITNLLCSAVCKEFVLDFRNSIVNITKPKIKISLFGKLFLWNKNMWNIFFLKSLVL